MTLLGFYVTYLLYLALRAFGELRAMNFIESRLKFHCATLAIVFSLLLSIMSNRYGRGVLEDNFIAQVLLEQFLRNSLIYPKHELFNKVYTSYQSEYHFLAFYTVLNCYVYVLAYMYAPTNAQVKKNNFDHVLLFVLCILLPKARETPNHLLRDNPTFSMLNESDNEADGPSSSSPGGVAETAVGININIDDDDDDEDEVDHRETDALMKPGDRSSPSPANAKSRFSPKPAPVVRWLGEDEDSD